MFRCTLIAGMIVVLTKILSNWGETRKGNCWDNAPMESFFNSLKNERMFHEDYLTREQAKRDLFGYIEVFYNRSRCHSALRYQNPAAKYAACFAQQKLAA